MMFKEFRKRHEYMAFDMLSRLPRTSSRFFSINDKNHKRLNLYCVGMPRSGTHSIAHMFAKNFRSKHEPFSGPTIKWLMRMKKNQYPDVEIRDYIFFRKLYMDLDLESAHYLCFIIHKLVPFDKDAKFIFTIRDPVSWLNSEINMNLKTGQQGVWYKYQKFKYGNYDYKYESMFLKNTPELFPLSSYLGYYKFHIKSILQNIPNHRLLILDTYEISHSTNKISAFAGIDIQMLNQNKSHVSKGGKIVNIREKIDQKLISDKVKEHCTDLFQGELSFMKKYIEQL